MRNLRTTGRLAPATGAANRARLSARARMTNARMTNARMTNARMTNARMIAACMIAACMIVCSCGPLSANEHAHEAVAPGPDSAVAARWQSEGWPMIETFCLDCHNQDYQEAELDLSSFRTLAGLREDNAVVLHVLNMVAFGAMPPEDYDLPSDAERDLLERLLDETHYAITCDRGPRAGRVTARRLNRVEYNNTVRDLFGIDDSPADRFPADEVGGGFDNNADVLSLSPLQIEKYFDAAESIASTVIFDSGKFQRSELKRSSDQIAVVGKSDTGSFNGRFLSPDAWAWTEVDVVHEGDYLIKIRAGSTSEDESPADLAVFGPDNKLAAVLSFKYFGGGGRSDTETFRMQLNKGRQRFCLIPVAAFDGPARLDRPARKNRSSKKPADPVRQALEVGVTEFPDVSYFSADVLQKGRRGFGRPLKPGRVDTEKYPFLVRHFEAFGPKAPPPRLYPPSHHEIVRRWPKSKKGKNNDLIEAASDCLQPLMRRAFREPVDDGGVQPYAELVRKAIDRGDSYEGGLQDAVAAILMSPRFLFRVETPPPDWTPSEDSLIPEDDFTTRGEGGPESRRTFEVPVTQHQLATRLSYFLWSSTPDSKLTELADRGALSGDELQSQIRRMLRSEKSRSLAEQFAGQWFGLRNLSDASPDAGTFAGFQPDLLPMMSRETELFFNHILIHNRPVAELITADYTFLNAPLASHYGVDFSAEPAGETNAFRKISLSDTPRRGLLGHASMLTLTSEPTRTSPVKRGKWILENILGTTPPEPPANVPELDEIAGDTTHLSLRRQLEIHRESPACSACHSVMDQLGFGLENFDAVGRYRSQDGELPIDARGELPGGRRFANAQELAEVLGQSERKAFARVVARRLLGFALGREISPEDRCTVDEIVESTAADGYRLMDIVFHVIRSRPFRHYRWTVRPDSD